MTFPCPTRSLCLDPATPFANFSAEAPDAHIFLARYTGFGPLYPPLGSDFLAVGCTTFCQSTVSQQDADQCAARGNVECLSFAWPTATPGFDVFGNPVPLYRGRTVFYSSQQSATVECADGNLFTYTLAAGIYAAFNQPDADNAALSEAARLAELYQVCISNLERTQICSTEPYEDSVTATGNFLDPATTCWSIFGSLPPGINSDLDLSEGCQTGSNTLNFFGTPTTPGIYSFAIQVQDSLGNYMFKPVTIRVMGITNSNPFPDGMLAVAYQEFIESLGVTNPIYSLEAGTLPDGLALDTTGVIFGTPTLNGTFDFTLGVTEAGTGITCNSPAQITITGTPFWAWIYNPDPPNTVFIPPNAATVSTTPSQITAMAQSDSAPNESAQVAGNADMFYAGPARLSNMHVSITSSAPNAAHQAVSVSIFQFGVGGLLSTGNIFPSGEYDFPFMVGASPGDTITMGFDVESLATPDGIGSTVSVVLTFT